MAEKILNLNTKEFDEVINKEKLVLIDFWAGWCAPCRMLAPIIEQIADQYEGKLIVGKVDIDDNQDLAVRYGIQTIPTVVLFKDGKVVAKEIGVKPLKAFTALVDSEIA